MQNGTVTRHGRGWRGYWREGGRSRATKTYQRKGEARAALNRELDRMRLGEGYMAPITLRELSDRWLAQYTAAALSFMLRGLGGPQERFQAIHVVGTNGKSTTTRLIEALLLNAGLAVGSYLSPHVRGWGERIRIGGDEADRVVPARGSCRCSSSSISPISSASRCAR